MQIFELQQYLENIHSNKEFDILFKLIQNKQIISNQTKFSGFNEQVLNLATNYNGIFNKGILYKLSPKYSVIVVLERVIRT